MGLLHEDSWSPCSIKAEAVLQLPQKNQKRLNLEDVGLEGS